MTTQYNPKHVVTALESDSEIDSVDVEPENNVAFALINSNRATRLRVLNRYAREYNITNAQLNGFVLQIEW